MAESLEYKTVKELRDLARKKNLEGRSVYTRKEELIAFILRSSKPAKTHARRRTSAPRKTPRRTPKKTPRRTPKKTPRRTPRKKIHISPEKIALVTKIAAITGQHKAFYNDWTVKDLEQRLEALLEDENDFCEITGKNLRLGKNPRYYITAYFSYKNNSKGIPLECLVDTGNSTSALPETFIKKLGIPKKEISKPTVHRLGGQVEILRSTTKVYVSYKNCKPVQIIVSIRKGGVPDGNLGMNWLLRTNPVIR